MVKGLRSFLSVEAYQGAGSCAKLVISACGMRMVHFFFRFQFSILTLLDLFYVSVRPSVCPNFFSSFALIIHTDDEVVSVTELAPVRICEDVLIALNSTLIACCSVRFRCNQKSHSSPYTRF